MSDATCTRCGDRWPIPTKGRSTMQPEDILTDWKAKADAATEGPWEVQREHHVCYIADGDECLYPESPIIERIVFRESEGCLEDAERHEHESYEAHAISPEIAGNYDYEEGGIIHTADAEFIAAARTAMPALLSAVESVLALHTPYEADGRNAAQCKACLYPWPCATVRAITDALNGSE